jgi:D-ornithine 4,5-aminomutase subunit alpha
LQDLSDEALYDYFWELAGKLVAPMMEAGKQYTTPSIERSILLRMGFSSIEAKPIVNGAMERNLMGKGCGNIVWRLSQKLGLSVREAGLGLAEGRLWDEVGSLFCRGSETT